MTVVALGCWTAFYVVAFLVRGAIQRRRTGHSGFLKPIGTSGWIAYTTVDIGLGGAFVALGADVAGLVDPVDALDGPVLHVTGAALFAAGLGLSVKAQRDLGTAWRAGIRPGERTELVTSGAFGRVRNPFFTGWLLALAGVAAMAPNVLVLASLACLWAGIELIVRRVEEPHLEQVHGDAYRDYRRRTGRFVTGIG